LSSGNFTRKFESIIFLINITLDFVFIFDDFRNVFCERKSMSNTFTAVVEKDSEWFVAYSPEIPGANGQGRTKDECLQNLAEAIELILQDRREDALRGLPDDAEHTLVAVG
jgi:predicted RNase H-like HicB family nuclease